MVGYSKKSHMSDILIKKNSSNIFICFFKSNQLNFQIISQSKLLLAVYLNISFLSFKICIERYFCISILSFCFYAHLTENPVPRSTKHLGHLDDVYANQSRKKKAEFRLSCNQNAKIAKKAFNSAFVAILAIKCHALRFCIRKNLILFGVKRLLMSRKRVVSSDFIMLCKNDTRPLHALWWWGQNSFSCLLSILATANRFHQRRRQSRSTDIARKAVFCRCF